jgi:hypothetical protein
MWNVESIRYHLHLISKSKLFIIFFLDIQSTAKIITFYSGLISVPIRFLPINLENVKFMIM